MSCINVHDLSNDHIYNMLSLFGLSIQNDVSLYCNVQDGNGYSGLIRKSIQVQNILISTTIPHILPQCAKLQ